jgi:hypothetical protein
VAVNIPDRHVGDGSPVDDINAIVDEVNRVGAIVDAQPALAVTAPGGAVSVELSATPWVVAPDGTPYYDPDATVAGRRGALLISPVDGGYVVAAP